ncbi:MAG: hypothetical protein LBP33_11350 [Candidatus Adiutrix sp.]|jgi:glycine cleavage system transcriptional repressor|nr:hypothetical protein [Candidatus Adiutrix sp.]
MRKVLVTIISHDRPGIIYQVSRALADNRVTVVEVSQTTLMGEFAGLFSCVMPAPADLDEFSRVLGRALEGTGLAHWVTDASGNGRSPDADHGRHEPYVVTVRGRDRPDIIPEFSGAMAGFDVNIDNLRAVARPPEAEGGDGGHQVLMFFELSVPQAVNQGAFRQALNLIAEDLGMEMSLQHRDVFEAIHRI